MSAPATVQVRRRRGFETVADMVRSLGLVLLVVAAILLVTLRSHPNPVKVVDYTDELVAARSAAHYHVLAPAGLSSGWRATSVRATPDVRGVHWHLGLLTPDGRYAAVEQSDGGRPAFVAEVTQDGRAAGTVDGWQLLRNGSETSLVRTSGQLTTVLTGTASVQQLVTLAGALH